MRKLWNWLVGKPHIQPLQDQDRRELDALKRDFQVKVRRSETLRAEIARIERPQLSRGHR